MVLQCARCQTDFEAKRSTAKFCSARCRQNSHQGADKAGDDGLVRSVRKELEDADRVDTFSGQLAIQLAKQVTAAGATGIASLSKELRLVMSEALAGTQVLAAEPDDDVVVQMKERRERKAREAASSA